MAEKIKIKDIALHAGVSAGTVDRVIHGRGKVSRQTQEKVEKAMEVLQYRPNIIARTLARKSPTHLHILLPYPYQDLYWKKIREGILHGFEDYDAFDIKKHLLFYDLYDKAHFETMVRSVLSAEPDAVILGSDFRKETIHFLRQCHKEEIPALLINAEIKVVPYLGFIGVDSLAAGRLAGRIIASTRGRRSILTVHIVQDLQNTSHFLNKEWGMNEILNRSDLPFSLHSLSLDPASLSRPEMTEHIAREIKKHDTDTLYITNSLAHQVAATLKKIFPDLYIIGHDLVGANISLLQKEIINVIIDQRSHLQGYLCIKTLVDHLVLNKNISRRQYLPLHIIYPENLPPHTEHRIKNKEDIWL